MDHGAAELYWGESMMGTRKRARIGPLVGMVSVLLLAAEPSAMAQSTSGEVRGTVLDTSGGIVPGASVTVTNDATGFTRTVASDTKGDFLFPLLQTGVYRLEVKADAFKTYAQQVTVRVLEATTVQVHLEIGEITEELVVTAETQGVNVTTGGVAQRLTEELSELPNLNHYLLANTAVLPSVGQSEERRETLNVQVAGNTTNRNAFYIDGAEATDPWRGWSPRQPAAEAFEEIVVNTAGATPDTGANFGGTFNAILKSGTNDFHGGAWYYFRDKGLNANSWVNNRQGLDRPNDPLKYWGAQIGGPVVKDKVFFYVTGHRETDEQPFTVTNRFAPTAAMVNGDFSALPFTILNPDTGQPFPGNVIPQEMLDPVAASFWNQYGYTIQSYANTHGFQFANERKVWNVNARLDFNLSDKHHVSLSGYYFKNSTSSPDARVQSISGSPTGGTSGNTFGDTLLGGTELSEFPQTVINLKHTWMASPNLFIETHGAYSDMPERVVLSDDALGTTLGTLGANDPLPRPGAPELLPSIVIGQWWGSPETAVLFHGWTTDFTSNNVTFGSSATWLSGSHSVKVGFEFQRGEFDELQVARENQNGLTFSGNATSGNNPSGEGFGSAFAHAFADFMLGRFENYGVNDESTNTLRSSNLAGYVMDTWRVTPRLTITPGLRYEFNTGIEEVDNKLTIFRPGFQSSVLPTAPQGIGIAQDPGIPESLAGSSHKLAPRFNFAYDVEGDGRTALRGSAGLYYGRDALALYQTNFTNRPPFSGASAIARNGILSNPWLTSQNPTYSAVPFPFTDQDPAAFVWPGQVSNLNGIDPNYSLPSSWQWNLSVEREIINRVRLEIGYQGNSSSDQPTRVPTNLAVFAAGANDGGSNIQERRPNQFAGDSLFFVENEGRSRFDQFIVVARTRRTDVIGQLSWVYTNARRNFAAGGVQSNRDWDGTLIHAGPPDELTSTQHNQTLSGYFLWDLPFLRGDDGALGKILGGWTITANGFWSFANKGGSVVAGFDSDADGFGTNYAEVNGAISYPRTQIDEGDLIYQWFDPGPFTVNGGSGSDRNFGPNLTLDGLNVLDTLPDAWRVDAALLKNFRMSDSARLQFRFEVFNLFNHANLNFPITSVTDSNLGKIRNKAGDGRRIQMGARLTF